jgi:hypothetical protein
VNATTTVGQSAIDTKAGSCSREAHFATARRSPCGDGNFDKAFMKKVGITNFNFSREGHGEEVGPTMGVGGGEHDLPRLESGRRGDSFLRCCGKPPAVADEIRRDDDDLVDCTGEVDGSGTQRLVDVGGSGMAISVAAEPDLLLWCDVILSNADVNHAGNLAFIVIDLWRPS